MNQYDAHVNYPCDPCENPPGRAKISAQVTEANQQIIQRRFALGTVNGKEFKLHVVTDPANPTSANNPLFWYEDFDNPIGQDSRGKTIYQRIFINEEAYEYLAEDHPARVLSRLPLVENVPSPLPVDVPPPLYSRVLQSKFLKGTGTGLASLGIGWVVGSVINYQTTRILESQGRSHQSAQHYGFGAGFTSGWAAGEGMLRPTYLTPVLASAIPHNRLQFRGVGSHIDEPS